MKDNTGKKIRLRGFAEADAVAFEAGIDAGVTTVGDIGKIAIIKEDGSLICEDYSFENQIPEMSKKIHKRGKWFKISTIALAIICLVGYFANAMHGGESYLGFSMAYIFLGLSFMSEAAVIGLGKFLGDQEMEAYAKFAGAKNAITNFFYTNKRIPSLEELKQTSRIIDRTDYIEGATFASTWIILGIFRLLPGLWFLPAALAFLGIMIFAEPGIFKKFWQKNIITSKPDEIHCQAAIKALEEAVKWTEQFSVKVSKKPITKDDFIAQQGHIFDEEKCSKCKSYKQCKDMWEKISDSSAEVYVYEVTMTYEGENEEE